MGRISSSLLRIKSNKIISKKYYIQIPEKMTYDPDNILLVKRLSHMLVSQVFLQPGAAMV